MLLESPLPPLSISSTVARSRVRHFMLHPFLFLLAMQSTGMAADIGGAPAPAGANMPVQNLGTEGGSDRELGIMAKQKVEEAMRRITPAMRSQWSKRANEETERVMRQLDANHDGRITVDELEEFNFRKGREEDKARIRKMEREGWRVKDLGSYEDKIDHNGDPLPGYEHDPEAVWP